MFKEPGLKPGSGATAWMAPGCAPAASPTGSVIDVTPAQAGQLGQIVAGAPAGATIRLADGTYPVTGSSSNRLVFSRPGVTLRSASGNPAAVVLDGQYAMAEIVQVTADDVTITDLTITRAVDHLVHAFPPDGRPSRHGLRLHRLALIDAGEQFVKVNPNALPGSTVAPCRARRSP